MLFFIITALHADLQVEALPAGSGIQPLQFHAGAR
jgi:hypothetical protein